MIQSRYVGTLLFLVSLLWVTFGCSQQDANGPSSEPVAASSMPDPDGFATFIGADEAYAMVQSWGDGLFVIDARKPEAYAQGHLPGAVNLPPDVWRTPKAKPGTAPGRHFYRVGEDDHGPLDAAYYNQALGAAGLTETDPVLVYGNHAGKADGSVPVMLLHLLGHRATVYFIDGVGADRLAAAGFSLTATPVSRPAATYTAEPRDAEVWDLADVRGYVADPDPQVVLWDTRSEGEWDGTEARGNARAGRIPGAVFLGFSELFEPGPEKNVLDRDAMLAKLTAAGITPDKTVVMYCQTATRVALPYQALRELGYDKLAIYDGSMAEYANLDDTPIELP